MFDLPASVRPLFEAAGWFPGRHTSASVTLSAHHPAASFLAEFGGLKVTPGEYEGEECAPNDMDIHEVTPDAFIKVWSKLLRTDLIGVAEVHYRHGELFVAEDGRCFGRSNIHPAFYFEGSTIAEAVERQLLGRRAKPMLRPDQRLVTLYGVTYTEKSPELYRDW
jgi:hypothetical protein